MRKKLRKMFLLKKPSRARSKFMKKLLLMPKVHKKLEMKTILQVLKKKVTLKNLWITKCLRVSKNKSQKILKDFKNSSELSNKRIVTALMNDT